MPTPHTGAAVLLVQPERDDRDRYAEVLRHQRLRPVPVSEAADALALASHVDIIVTDLLLPGHLTGVEFVTRLKANSRTQRIPVIVLTACAWPSERQLAKVAGCDVFLEAPCLPDLFLGEVRRALTLYRLPASQPVTASLMPTRGRRAS